MPAETSVYVLFKAGVIMEKPLKNLLSPYAYADVADVLKSDIDFSLFKDKTLLVTGAGSSAGYYIVCALMLCNDLYKTNIKIIAVDSSDSIFEKYESLMTREDVEFLVSEVYDNFGTYNADYIIHNEKVSKNTIEAIYNLLQYIKLCSPISVVISNPSEIYGTIYNSKTYLLENESGYVNLASPKEADIQTARMAECVALNFTKSENLNIKFARCAEVYGALPCHNDNMLYALKNSFKDGETASITFDDNTAKSFCYAADCAKALLCILLSGKNGEIYNIADDNSIANNFDFAQTFMKYMNIPVVYGKKNKRSSFSPMKPSHKILNIDKAKALGFKPKTGLDAGLKKTAVILSEH